ncbi:hypothetical protein CASFOL_029264 [Castilleja foliolosa]|uniref:CCHC-type domain-containing protein n=1 Tax=Castilleja foliolosa TaxID=1961234 RepID=A0ABD3CBZ6_9LAMI
MTSTNNSNFNIRSILEKEKLNGTNFLDWHRNLRIVLRLERKEFVLDTPIPIAPEQNSTAAQRTAEKNARDSSIDVTCLMLASMEPGLQKQFENMEAFDIIQQLKDMFQEQARIERFETSKAILDARLEKGKPVGPHVLKMMGLFETSERLGFAYKSELATDIILHSLHDGFDHFKLGFYMNGMEKSLTELHGMLKVAESSIKAEPKHESRREVLMVQKGKGFKKGLGKGKGKGISNVAKPKAGSNGLSKSQKTSLAESQCFYCNVKGHYRRDCPKFLEDVKNGTVANIPGIYGLKRSRQLGKGEVDLRVGNGSDYSRATGRGILHWVLN